MKNILTTLALVLFSLSVFAQTVPSASLLDLDYQTVNSSAISRNNGAPVVLIFWATWNANSKKFLAEVSDVYFEWQSTKGAKVTIVSIDDQRNMHKVKPYLDSKGWEYEAFIDPNQDLKRAMNVNSAPHVFILNGQGNIIWETSQVNDHSTISEISQRL